MGLLDPLGREVHVGPPREPVLEVPGALAVPQKNQLDHVRSSFFYFFSWNVTVAEVSPLALPKRTVACRFSSSLLAERVPPSWPLAENVVFSTFRPALLSWVS